jgi:drug/metabolite transporter (DMT)-like permease
MFIKIALEDGLTDPFIVFARTLLGALVLAPFALRSGAFRAAREHIGWLALIAGVQIVTPFLLITIGQNHVPSSLAGVLVASAPIFTALIAAVAVQTERLEGVAVIGILVGMAGIALLFGVDLGGDQATLLGGLGILLASVGYATGALIAKRKLVGVAPEGIAATIMGLSALALLPTVPFAAPDAVPGLGTFAALVALGAGRHRHRLPALLHAQRGDRPEPRGGRRLHRPGVQRPVRRDPARRVVHPRHRRRARAHPRRLVRRGRGPRAVAPAPRAGARRDARVGG